MASVKPYVTSRGEKRWRVDYRTPERQTRTKRFTTRREAADFARDVEVSKRHGSYVDTSAGRQTVAQHGTDRLERRRPLIKASVWNSEESTWRVHVEPRWGKVAIADVKPSAVQTWISELSTTKSASTVKRAHGILYGILADAVQDGRLARNAAENMHLPKRKASPRQYLNHEQVELLATVAGGHGTIVRTLAYTGLRWGELIGLRVRHVNFLKRRLIIEENAVWSRGTVTLETPKTHEKRTVPFPDFLAVDLSRLTEGKSRDALLFGDGHNHMRPPSSQRGWYTVAVEAAKAADSNFPRVTVHDLRHTAASLAVASGAHVKAIQKMLGHASAAMTLDTYADLFDADLDAVADSLNHARQKALAVKTPSKHES